MVGGSVLQWAITVEDNSGACWKAGQAMDKKMVYYIVFMCMLGLGLYLYLEVPAVTENVTSVIDRNFKEENIYTDVEAVAKQLGEEIKKGADEFVFYIKDMDIREITVIFKTSAHEGDVLSMLYKKEGDILNCGLYFEDGRPSLLAQIRIANA